MALKLDRQQLEAARQLFAHPLVHEILDEFENTNLSNAVTTNPLEKEKVAAFLAEVRAIRSFRDRLSFIVQDGDETLRREAAAQSGAAKK
jgi:hypothetical protein